MMSIDLGANDLQRYRAAATDEFEGNRRGCYGKRRNETHCSLAVASEVGRYANREDAKIGAWLFRIGEYFSNGSSGTTSGFRSPESRFVLPLIANQ
jgi:hypothetical protein